jgi:hypothetical protein
LLLVFPDYFEERTYEKVAEITNDKPCLKTINNHMSRVCKTCSTTDSKINKDLLYRELNKFFSQNYNPVVPIGSRFYQEPVSALKKCKEEIIQPQALLRIQAPMQRGKTSFLARVTQHAKSLHYRVATVDFFNADRATLQNLNSLLQWLCRKVCKQLNLDIAVSDRWDEEDDSKGACTSFFEEYFLQSTDPPLLLSLDNLEEIFLNPSVGVDVCILLRAWKQQESDNWRNMRMTILHTWYAIGDIDPSPLANVGTLIVLPELTIEQTTNLVELYNLKWKKAQIESLIDLVGLHPFLIRLALDRIAREETSLENVLARGHLPNELFQQHLEKHLRYLERKPELRQIVRKILKEEYPLNAELRLLTQLRDAGILKHDGSRDILANKLYYLYFKMHIGEG